MATFVYTVRDTAGVVRTGSSEAENEEILARRLREQGFAVTEIKQTKKKKAAAGANSFLQNLQKVKVDELAMFFRQFSTMVEAGVSFVRCLTVLSEQTENARLRRIIHEMLHEVEAGQTLSKCMGKYPRVFDNLMVGLVHAGEIGGVLEETLNRLSVFIENDVALRRKVKSAMTYPTIVLYLAGGIICGLCYFIVPKFIDLFKSMGVKEMPFMTQVLIAISNFLLYKSWLAIMLVFGIKFGFAAINRTKTGKIVIDKITLMLPVVGNLNLKVGVARFARTLGTLLVSGVPILQAMETVAGVVGNQLMADAIMEARARIREGDRIGEPLKKSGLFAPMVVHMISIGEESGALDQMLSKVADFYEDEVNAALDDLSAAIEPVMICLLGGIVLFILLALWMPIIAIIQQLSGGDGGKDDG
ncbi:MAG: type II secretion system F family protein [Capsulimonadaceae bacterium]|nr:type II secretion system F family protein [Capsulimonadaceae bacterium]